MTIETKKSFDKKSNNTIKLLVISASALVVVLVALAVMILSNNLKDTDLLNGNNPAGIIAGNDKILKGVSLNGVDLSGMTKEEALSATASVPGNLLIEKKVSINVGGEIIEYSAKDLGMETDYEDVIEKAVSFGRTGTDEGSQGMAFTVSVVPVKENLEAVLNPLKEKFDKAPADASFVFAPWGYLADGTPYEPDIKDMIESCAKNKTIKRPELVRIPKEEMPNKLRYQYWKNTRYIKNYIPADADISRFQYKDGVKGLSVNMEALINSIIERVKNGDFSAITAPAEETEPAVKLEDIKYGTQLIASWTSSYSNHKSYSRNWNVAKLSGIINGVVIKPGKTWSINKEAGPRTESKGWKEAAGISNGGYTPQDGGGVCQISSTLYNAAIRTALDITEHEHHSIISDYIPLGLDATISTGSPDLKLKNPYDTPVYIVSYVNPKDLNVTVEIYGAPLKDKEHGEIILNFSFKDGGSFGSPKMLTYFNVSKAPDGKSIGKGKSYEFSKARRGRRVQTYKHTLSLDGKELEKVKFTSFKWNPINGKTYVNVVALN